MTPSLDGVESSLQRARTLHEQLQSPVDTWRQDRRAARLLRRRDRTIERGVRDFLDVLQYTDYHRRLSAPYRHHAPVEHQASIDLAATAQDSRTFAALDGFLTLAPQVAVRSLTNTRNGVLVLADCGYRYRDLADRVTDHSVVTLTELALNRVSDDLLDVQAANAVAALRDLLPAAAALDPVGLTARIHRAVALFYERQDRPREAFQAFLAAGDDEDAHRIALTHVREIAALAPDAAETLARDSYKIDPAQPEIQEMIRSARNHHLATTDQHDQIDQWQSPSRAQIDADPPERTARVAELHEVGRNYFLAGDYQRAQACFDEADGFGPPVAPPHPSAVVEPPTDPLAPEVKPPGPNSDLGHAI